ncbi:uncharacterized protein [Typha angustifolia]|uniref:uncharacterized protein n=1 Tax=Typha angustifolia TaxID=59011 RepID=UPI003C2E5206
MLAQDYLKDREILARFKDTAKVQWERPSEGWIKINVDGSWKAGEYQGGAGFIIRDENGTRLRAAMEPTIADSASYSEVWALQAGLREAYERWEQVIVETDALSVIRMFRDEDNCLWRLKGGAYRTVARC